MDPLGHYWGLFQQELYKKLTKGWIFHWKNLFQEKETKKLKKLKKRAKQIKDNNGITDKQQKEKRMSNPTQSYTIFLDQHLTNPHMSDRLLIFPILIKTTVLTKADRVIAPTYLRIQNYIQSHF